MVTEENEWGPSDQRATHDLGELVFDLSGNTGLTSHLTEESLACSIRYVVLSQDKRSADDLEFIKDFFLAIADALDSPHSLNKLKLVRPRGRSESFVQAHLRISREAGLVWDTHEAFQRLGKMEAAVAETVASYKIARATVFRALKRAAMEAREDAAGNPPCFSPDEESRQFQIWLDRFADCPPEKVR